MHVDTAVKESSLLTKKRVNWTEFDVRSGQYSGKMPLPFFVNVRHGGIECNNPGRNPKARGSKGGAWSGRKFQGGAASFVWQFA